jgi:hypothetical protein
MAYNNKHCKPCRPIINEVCIDKPENCPKDVCAEIYNAECVILPDGIPENCLGITGGMNIVDAIQIIISAICDENQEEEIPEITFGPCFNPYDSFFMYFNELWRIYKNDPNFSINMLLGNLLKNKIYITTCNTCYDVGDIHIFGGSENGTINIEDYPGYYFNDNINGYSDCISSLNNKLEGTMPLFGIIPLEECYIEVLSNVNENGEIHSILCSIDSYIDMNVFSAEELRQIFNYFIKRVIKLEIFENYIVFSQID